MTRRLVALAVIAACGTIPRARMIAEVETAPQTAGLVSPITFGPLVAPATAYNEPARVLVTTPARDVIFGGLVASARDHGDPQRDPRLDLAATELAQFIARGGTLDDAVVEFALRGHGVVETATSLRVSDATTPAAVLSGVVPALATTLDYGNVHVGVGGGDGQPFVVLVIHMALATLRPTVPRALPLRGQFVFAANLDSSFHAPRITVTFEDDRLREHPKATKVDPITFQAVVACGDHTGTAWLLIEACDTSNVVQRLALVPVSCGEPLETTYRSEPRANTAVPPSELAHRLAAIINRERAALHLPALAGDLRAERAARVETELMLRHHSVAHELEQSTTLGRLRAEGLLAPFTLEATLHAKDLATAAEILLDLRGYRETILGTQPTHLGISIVADEEGELYIALELVNIVPPIDTVRLEAQMLERIAERRPEFERHHPLVRNPLLDHIARSYARQRSTGWSDPTVTDATQHDLVLAFGEFGITWRALTLLLADDIELVDLGPDKRYDGVGLAVVQSPRNGALAGRTYVIVLYGTLRSNR